MDAALFYCGEGRFVGHHGGDLGAVVTQCGHRGVQTVLPDIGQDQMDAARRERLGEALAEAAGRAGDHRDLTAGCPHG